MNIPTIIVMLILIIIVGLAIKKIIKNKKNGKCACGCEACANKIFCERNKNKS